MLDRQIFVECLEKTVKSEKAKKENIAAFDLFRFYLEGQGTGLADVTKDTIYDFVQLDNVNNSAGAIQVKSEFLARYASCIEKSTSPALSHLAAVINEYIRHRCETVGKRAAKARKELILPMPEGVKINPELLNGLTNSQFTEAFKALQRLVVSIYEDIEKDALAWGYPDYYATGGYYNRVNDILFAIVFCGTHSDGRLTVDTKRFFASALIKRHKKLDLMAAGLERMGFSFADFNKKSEAFHVSCPANPHIITALYAYVSQIDENKRNWELGKPLHSFSHRFVEDPATQKYETVFLTELDYSSDKRKEILCWLYQEALKYGFSVDTNTTCALNITKGSKSFLTVSEGVKKEGQGHITAPSRKDIEANNTQINTKTSFIHAFEKDPDGMRQLCSRFPHIFRLDDPGTCCHENKCTFRMRFTFDGVSYKRCGLGNFWFEDISLDDVKAIVEMFKVEKKIK